MNFAITVRCPAICVQDVLEMIYFATLNSLIIFDIDVRCISLGVDYCFRMLA